MKHIFIINPAAGKYDRTGEVTQQIREVFAGRDCEILVSRSMGDCTHIAHAAAATGEPVRLYACGGDGTLNEVVSGVVGFSNAEVTVFPGGTGNDFIKVFSDPAAFRDPKRLLEGEVAEFDLIRCQKDHYSLNICSMGLDARIGTSMSKYKRLPLVSGSGAYYLSTGVHLVKGLHKPYEIEIDGECIRGDQTMIAIANGRWYGGSFYAVPDAEPDDGFMNVLIVRKISRLTVPKVIGKYKSGKYRELTDYVRHFRCKKVVIRSEAPSEINLDGELLMAKEAVFELLPKAVRFFYPKGLTYHCKG